jgi:hypothetical protein
VGWKIYRKCPGGVFGASYYDLFDIGLTKHFNLVVESMNIQLLEHETDPGCMANKEELDGLRKILFAQAMQQRGLLVERQEDFHIELEYSSQLHWYGVYEVGQVDTEMMVAEWGVADTSVLGIPPISQMVDISNKVGVCSYFVPGSVVLLSILHY